MIYHTNRMSLKSNVTQEQLDEAMRRFREQGAMPMVKSFFLGREHGTEFDWAAVFVLEDLDAYWEYLTHPSHAKSQEYGVPLMEKFEAFDISDDPDTELTSKIADLQRRNYEADPHLVTLMSGLASHTGSSALSHTE
ncbi:Dabb family protein [Nocardia callitridis]|uniref:Stress-response A/B barrel domain-containing protein n=1 Tax=Nocardia callitridis TaxID=648753 RepID=A0ABP9L4I6_9NOCA